MSQALLRPAGQLDDESELHLLTLNHMLVQRVGKYWDWDSDALRSELEERFGSIGVLTWQRIQAGRLMLSNNLFWTEWEVFENCCAAINGHPPIFSYVQPPDAEEIAVAIETAHRIIPEFAFSEEVKGYMAAACLYDGLWVFESPLHILQPSLLEHDGRKNIERDFTSVHRRLEGMKTYVDAETAADMQANRVLGVRSAMASYIKDIESQIDEVTQ